MVVEWLDAQYRDSPIGLAWDGLPRPVGTRAFEFLAAAGRRFDLGAVTAGEMADAYSAFSGIPVEATEEVRPDGRRGFRFRPRAASPA